MFESELLKEVEGDVITLIKINREKMNLCSPNNIEIEIVGNFKFSPSPQGEFAEFSTRYPSQEPRFLDILEIEISRACLDVAGQLCLEFEDGSSLAVAKSHEKFQYFRVWRR